MTIAVDGVTGRVVQIATARSVCAALHRAKERRPASPRAFACLNRAKRQCLISGGSLPPLAASLVMTCLCSQMFMLAESLLSPV